MDPPILRLIKHKIWLVTKWTNLLEVPRLNKKAHVSWFNWGMNINVKHVDKSCSLVATVQKKCEHKLLITKHIGTAYKNAHDS